MSTGANVRTVDDHQNLHTDAKDCNEIKKETESEDCEPEEQRIPAKKATTKKHLKHAHDTIDTNTNIEEEVKLEPSDLSNQGSDEPVTSKDAPQLNVTGHGDSNRLTMDKIVEVKKEVVDFPTSSGSGDSKAILQKPPVKSTRKSRGRQRNAQKQSKSSGHESSSAAKPSTSSTQRRKNSPKNHLLTEYFPVRRSDRMSKSDLQKMESQKLEDMILSGCENGLKVVDIEGKGRGVVSTKPFKRGDFVVEYAGELISLTEAQAKEDQYSYRPDIGCYMYYFKFKNRNYCVDATAESGKLGRLLNHSKSGNCKTKVVGIGDQPYLILVAAREISIGEELLYDYGDRSKQALDAHPWLAK